MYMHFFTAEENITKRYIFVIFLQNKLLILSKCFYFNKNNKYYCDGSYVLFILIQNYIIIMKETDSPRSTKIKDNHAMPNLSPVKNYIPCDSEELKHEINEKYEDGSNHGNCSSCADDSAFFCSSNCAAEECVSTVERNSSEMTNCCPSHSLSASTNSSTYFDSVEKSLVVNGIHKHISSSEKSCSNITEKDCKKVKLKNSFSSPPVSPKKNIVQEKTVSITSSSGDNFHNLRKRIRRKTCCGCDCSSHTTVIVRRLTKIKHQSPRKMSPSPQKTKAKCASNHNAHLNFKPDEFMVKEEPSPSRKNKRRRTEVDKLYADLQEIVWAKDWGRDNILSQSCNKRTFSSSSDMHKISKTIVKTSVRTYKNIDKQIKTESKNFEESFNKVQKQVVKGNLNYATSNHTTETVKSSSSTTSSDLLEKDNDLLVLKNANCDLNELSSISSFHNANNHLGIDFSGDISGDEIEMDPLSIHIHEDVSMSFTQTEMVIDSSDSDSFALDLSPLSGDEDNERSESKQNRQDNVTFCDKILNKDTDVQEQTASDTNEIAVHETVNSCNSEINSNDVQTSLDGTVHESATPECQLIPSVVLSEDDNYIFISPINGKENQLTDFIIEEEITSTEEHCSEPYEIPVLTETGPIIENSFEDENPPPLEPCIKLSPEVVPSQFELYHNEGNPSCDMVMFQNDVINEIEIINEETADSDSENSNCSAKLEDEINEENSTDSDLLKKSDTESVETQVIYSNNRSLSEAIMSTYPIVNKNELNSENKINFSKAIPKQTCVKEKSSDNLCDISEVVNSCNDKVLANDLSESDDSSVFSTKKICFEEKSLMRTSKILESDDSVDSNLAMNINCDESYQTCIMKSIDFNNVKLPKSISDNLNFKSVKSRKVYCVREKLLKKYYNCLNKTKLISNKKQIPNSVKLFKKIKLKPSESLKTCENLDTENSTSNSICSDVDSVNNNNILSKKGELSISESETDNECSTFSLKNISDNLIVPQPFFANCLETQSSSVDINQCHGKKLSSFQEIRTSIEVSPKQKKVTFLKNSFVYSEPSGQCSDIKIKKTPHFNISDLCQGIKRKERLSVSTEFIKPKRSKDDTSFVIHDKFVITKKNSSFTKIIMKHTRGTNVYLCVEALNELTDAFNSAIRDTTCRVLILCGSGDSFCSGIDLKPLLSEKKKEIANETAVALKNFIEVLAGFHKPLVSVVNGKAIGFGVTLLTYCDIILASDKATFHMPYSELGYFPEGAATLMLPRVIGPALAMDMMLRGRILTAQEAKNFKLISEVIPAENLAEELVAKIQGLEGHSISAMEMTKGMVRMHFYPSLTVCLENEVEMLPKQWLSQVCQNALQNADDMGLI